MARKLPIAQINIPSALDPYWDGRRKEWNADSGRLPVHLLAPVPGGHLLKVAAHAWQAMVAGALADGIELRPTSRFDLYRPFAVQERAFFDRYYQSPLGTKRYKGKRYRLRRGVSDVATPGRSNHGWGLAVDVANISLGGRLDWLLANAARFGFSWELQREPWHLRYVAGDDTPDAVAPFAVAQVDWASVNASISSLIASTPKGVAAAPAPGDGVYVVGSDGGVFAYDGAKFFGSLPGLGVKVDNIVGITATPTGEGYWLAGADGGVFCFGDAVFLGSMGGHPLNASVLGIVATASGNGYTLGAADGGVFAFGDAEFLGRPTVPCRSFGRRFDGGNGYAFVDVKGEIYSFPT